MNWELKRPPKYEVRGEGDDKLQYVEAVFNKIIDDLERDALSMFQVESLKELILTGRDVASVLKGRKHYPDSNFFNLRRRAAKPRHRRMKTCNQSLVI